MFGKPIKGLLALILLLTLAGAASAGIPGDLDRNDMISDTELSKAIIPFMKAEFLGQNIVHLARGQMTAASLFYHDDIYPPEDDTVLRIGTPNVVKSDAFCGDYYVGIFSHLSNMPLMRMDENGHLLGQTAERYEVSGDNTVWTFYIRDDLYWSDGMKVNPEDVAFTFTYLGEKVAETGWIGETLESVSVSEEDNSVTFRFSKPYTRINLEFATYNLLPEHIWKEIENPKEHTGPGPYVGCGPYYLDEINLDSARLIYRKNPHWKGKDPAFGSVEVDWFANKDAACFALEGGSVDTYYQYANSYPYANIGNLNVPEDFETVEKTSIGLTYLGINLDREPLSDVNFRKALSYAIDYNELVNLETLGYGEVPNRGFVPPGMDHFKETEKLSYNVTRAREILNTSGYTDIDGNGIFEAPGQNEDLCLDLLLRTGYERYGDYFTDYLTDAGIGVSVHQVDTGTWFELKDNHEYDLTITGTTPWGMLMHASWGTGYFDSRRTGKGVLHNLNDPEFLGLCDEILATTDQNELRELGSELQDYYAANLPGIPLYWKKDVTPYNRDFSGWHTNPLFGIYNLDTFLNVRNN